MIYDAGAVANYLLEVAEEERCPLDCIKLQKLIYFAHGWSLAITGEPLINEPVEAWKFGIVIPSIYYEFKRFGNEPITRKFYFGRDEVYKEQIIYHHRTTTAQLILNKIWSTHSELSNGRLSYMTLVYDSPWDTVRKATPKYMKSADIPNDLIKEYFKKLWQVSYKELKCQMKVF